MNQTLPIFTDLANVFPDIEGELCSRHSILMGKLRNTFGKIYDNMEPSHYIVVKGVLDLYSEDQVTLSMALENGIVLLVRDVGQGQPIYINSNHFDSELILTPEGVIEQGLNEYVSEIETAVRAANEGLSSDKLHGCIFYLHSNIVQSSFSYSQIMLISIFLGISLVNGTLASSSLQQLIKRMSQYRIFGDETFLRKLFNFKNRQFSLQVGDEQFNLSLQKNNKLVLCQLDLAKMDVKYQQNRRRQLLQRKEEILKYLKVEHHIDSFFQLFQLEEELVVREEIVNQNDPVMAIQNFLSVALKELGLISEFNNANITFEQYVSAQWELNSKYWMVHSEEVVQLVDQIKNTLKLNSCMIINQTYALIVTDKSKYTELLVFLRQKLHKGELKSKSLFKIQEELIQHRWSSDKRIGEKMFTSVPSEGVAVFDPKDAIWFD